MNHQKILGEGWISLGQIFIQTNFIPANLKLNFRIAGMILVIFRNRTFLNVWLLGGSKKKLNFHRKDAVQTIFNFINGKTTIRKFS